MRSVFYAQKQEALCREPTQRLRKS